MNRQVPNPEGVQPLKQQHIAIVGNGRVARHMIRYFELLDQPYIQWFRASSKSSADAQTSRLARYKLKLKQLVQPSRSSTLKEMVEEVNVVLVLLPDDQIDPFIEQNPCLQDKRLIHFSGSLNSAYASGCHPLMTFGHELYDLKQYQSIPFVVDEGFEFKHVFPLFKNSFHTIKPEQKVLYHAMCVMAGNFSQLLWQATSDTIEQLGLPEGLMNDYLLQNTKNFISNPHKALTGPFVRGDANTIEQHLTSLQQHPLGPIYQSFYDLYHQHDQAIQRSQP